MTVALQGDLEGRVGGILNRHPAVGLAVGVVRNGSPEAFVGHGFADIASRTPITEDTVFHVGSLTKTFTAIAVMQLHEQGLVDLDAPVGDYLRAFRLRPADAAWRPVTARHLLTHTAGIREVLHPWAVARPLFGETVTRGRRVPSPAEYYRAGLRVGAEPGTRFRYTDHGFAALGQVVEDVIHQPFGTYLRERVFLPLGMTDTDLVPSPSTRSRLAVGYALRSSGPEPVPDYGVVTAGGAAAFSTPRDIGRYLAALLGGGANQHGVVLKPETLAAMFAPHYRSDPRLPGPGGAVVPRAHRGPAVGGPPGAGVAGLGAHARRASVSRSSAATSAAMRWWSTRGWCRRSRPRSSWHPPTASPSWPSRTARLTACSGCRSRRTDCSAVCSASGTSPSARTSRTGRISGPISAAGTGSRVLSPTRGREECWEPVSRCSSVADGCTGGASPPSRPSTRGSCCIPTIRRTPTCSARTSATRTSRSASCSAGTRRRGGRGSTSA